MPEDIRASEELVDVGETVGADINLDDKGEPVKQEEVVEEKIEVEEILQKIAGMPSHSTIEVLREPPIINTC